MWRADATGDVSAECRVQIAEREGGEAGGAGVSAECRVQIAERDKLTY